MDRALGCHRHTAQQVEAPLGPAVFIAHGLQQAVVVRLGGGDVAAEVKHGQIKQTITLQHQEIQDPPGASVAIVKRVNALELMMGNRHPQQGIETIVGVDEVNQVGHQRLHLVSVLRWLIDRLPGGFVFQNGARQFTQPRSVLLQLRLHGQQRFQPDQPGVPHRFVASAQSGNIVPNLLSSRGPTGFFLKGIQLVVRRDDIFNFRAILRFLNAESIEQNPLIWQRLTKTF